VVFSALGGYLATQSREHRDEERKARRRHLDLRALGPFIVDLSVEEQQKIRGELARNAFLSQTVDSPTERSPRRGISTDQLRTVAEIIATARK
jgi:hypothetical protein